MKGGGPLRHGLVYGRYFKHAVPGWTDGRGRHHPGALPERLHGLRFPRPAPHLRGAVDRNRSTPEADLCRRRPLLITITLDRYGHLFPSVEEALGEKARRGFQLVGTRRDSE